MRSERNNDGLFGEMVGFSRPQNALNMAAILNNLFPRSDLQGTFYLKFEFMSQIKVDAFSAVNLELPILPRYSEYEVPPNLKRSTFPDPRLFRFFLFLKEQAHSITTFRVS